MHAIELQLDIWLHILMVSQLALVIIPALLEIYFKIVKNLPVAKKNEADFPNIRCDDLNIN